VNLSGSVELGMENLNQPELALSIRGSGTLRGQGNVDQLSVTVSGSGNAKAGRHRDEAARGQNPR
jgi:hypothetical protein